MYTREYPFGLFGKRFYLLIILELKSRMIVRYDLTENPCRECVKQRIELFSEGFPDQKTLIHDNASQFTFIDFSSYGIKGVNICTAAPNMNAFTERVIGSIRDERHWTNSYCFQKIKSGKSSGNMSIITISSGLIKAYVKFQQEEKNQQTVL